jgi:pyruvate dehydrogenase E2 component (dihydrolipoamide acetyltransferase)
MSDLKEFKLPDVGEGLTEADIIRWHVKPGDTVTVNQIIVEIETAKAVVELPSPYAGTVARLLVPEGQTADVGTPIIAVDTSADGSGQAGPVPPEAQAQRAISQMEDMVPAPPVEGASEPGMTGSPAPKAERQAVLVGYGVKLGSASSGGQQLACRGRAGKAAGAQDGAGPRRRSRRPGRHWAERLYYQGRRPASGGTGPDRTRSRSRSCSWYWPSSAGRNGSAA